MRNNFDTKDESEKTFMSMKHHFTNLGLMGLLIALLAVPMTGFYILDYSDLKSDGLQIPDYIPVTILNNSEVLSESSMQIEETLVTESTVEDISTTVQNVEVPPVSSINTTQENQAEEFEFDPAQYQPANIYPVYR